MALVKGFINGQRNVLLTVVSVSYAAVYLGEDICHWVEYIVTRGCLG